MTSLILTLLLGIILGVYLTKGKGNIITKQIQKKAIGKEKILEFLRKNQKITNNDIEKLLRVSDATATRYLNKLEKEGEIRQIGTTGHAVYYVPVK